MKSILRIVCLLLFIYISGNAQEIDTEFCPMGEDSTSQLKMTTMSTTSGTLLNDGLYITAHGELKVLIVFVRFPGDDLDLDFWREDDAPSILNSIIDPSSSTNSTNKYNLTHFFDVMSVGDFDVVGEAISVVAPQTAAGYGNNLGVASKDILDYVSDNDLANFADYDNWTTTAEGVHSNTPDGLVDMVVMIYKGENFVYNVNWGGCAAMYKIDKCNGAYTDPLELNPGTLSVNGGKSIKFDVGVGNGSGVVAFARSDERVLFNYVKHEISHWLLGAGHPYPSSNNASANRVASLLSGSLNRSMSVNAVERDRLGWGRITKITSNLSNVIMGDFLETGVAYKYEAVKSSRTNVHFYFTNHQNVTIYDDATTDATDKGIFITRVGTITENNAGIRYLASDGDWDWENTSPFWVFSPWDTDPGDGIDSLGVFKKTIPNPKNGGNFTTSKRADNFNNKEYWLYAYKNQEGILDIDGYYTGLSSSDMKASFNMNYGRIFGPHTNPLPEDATDWNGSHYEDFGMLVKSSSGTTVTVDFKYNYNPYTISENTTWDGQIFLDENVTVQSGKKLTIKSNTQVFIDDGKAINVYGELEADGVNFTAMDNNWKGITYHSGSDGYIRNSTIEKVHEYGGAAIRVYSNNYMEIDGNTIQNLTGAASGISLSNADNVYIYDNRIENTTNYGIYAYNSDAKIFDNFIKNFTNSGIYASSYSHVVLSAISGSNYVGENTVVGGKYGLQIGYQAYLNAGSSSSFGSQNRIANQSGSGWAHIYSTSAYSNTAKYNYYKPYNGYGGSGPTTNGSISVYPWLYTDPDPGAGFKVVATEETEQSKEELLLEEAMMYKYEKNYKESEKILSTLIRESNEEVIIQQSLMEYAWVARLSKDESFFMKLEEFEADFSSSINEVAAKSALAKVHYSRNQYDKALKQLDKIIEKNPNTEDEQAALIFASYVATDAGYLDRATEYYGQATNDKFKSSSQKGELLELNHYMQSLLNNSNGENTLDERADLEMPKSISLSNYPNPFNPSTTINYALPEQAGVTLKLYDLLGREVAILVNEVKEAGEYSVSFDASRLSSGVYIYQLKVGETLLSKKMTLIK